MGAGNVDSRLNYRPTSVRASRRERSDVAPQPPEWVEWTVSIGAALIAVAPAFLITIGFYHWMTFRGVAGDGKTRCGRCGGVLIGLDAPRCSYCEEPI